MSVTELRGYRDACFAFCRDIHAAVCFQPQSTTFAQHGHTSTAKTFDSKRVFISSRACCDATLKFRKFRADAFRVRTCVYVCTCVCVCVCGLVEREREKERERERERESQSCVHVCVCLCVCLCLCLCLCLCMTRQGKAHAYLCSTSIFLLLSPLLLRCSIRVQISSLLRGWRSTNSCLWPRLVPTAVRHLSSQHESHFVESMSSFTPKLSSKTFDV